MPGNGNLHFEFAQLLSFYLMPLNMTCVALTE
jgi:hypothetical protein